MTPTPTKGKRGVPHTLIAIDPSITCTGIAEFDNGELVGCYRITPSAGDATVSRINQIMTGIDEVVPHFSDRTEFVIEITSGKTSGRHGGGGAGLATYGMVVGHVARYLIETQHPGTVHQVYENDWTRGRGRKDKRVASIRYAYPEYTANDPGGDIADAIGLGEWWLQRRRLEQTA